MLSAAVKSNLFSDDLPIFNEKLCNNTLISHLYEPVKVLVFAGF